MQKVWFATKDLLGVAGLPTTYQGINKRAYQEVWRCRRRTGVQGRALEYHMSSLPKNVQAVLKERNIFLINKLDSCESLEVWTLAYHQMRQIERDQVIALLLHSGVTGLLIKMGFERAALELN